MSRPSDPQSQPQLQQSNGLYTLPNTHVRVRSGQPVAESWLTDQGVLVFGGATAAGAAVVRALADVGAYVTIADSNADEGQRLMLELVGRNLRVQYIFTNLPVFRSQTEAIHYASVFSPTLTLSVIICAAIPPPPPSRGPSLSILHWLRTTTPDLTFPDSLPPPSTAPLDRAVTVTYHAVHLALHHFRQSPPLIPERQQSNHTLQQHRHNGSSPSPKSASGTTPSPPSHRVNYSPTSFKTAGTSTSGHAAPVIPSLPAPALPLDPSTALRAHPVVIRGENGETSTSPKCPTTPGFLPVPGAPAPLSATEPSPPSPESPAARALEASTQTLNPTAESLPSERKHLVVLVPARFLSEEVDDEDEDEDADADADSDEALGRGRRALHALPPHHLAERAAAAGLRAMVKALEELCEVDAVGPGINVGCVPWEEEDATNGHIEPEVKTHPEPENGEEINTADDRCVRGVMRMLCSRSGAVTQKDLEAHLFADEPTDVEADVEADADDEASALGDDDQDSASSTTSDSTSLMLSARSVASLDRPSPLASRSAQPPALGQVREEEEDEKGMSPTLSKDSEREGVPRRQASGRGWTTTAKGVESGGHEVRRWISGAPHVVNDEDEEGHAVSDDMLGAIGTAVASRLVRRDETADQAAQQRQCSSSESRYDDNTKSDNEDTDDAHQASGTSAVADAVAVSKPQLQQPPVQPAQAAASKGMSIEASGERPAENMKPLPATPNDAVAAHVVEGKAKCREHVMHVQGWGERRHKEEGMGKQGESRASISSEFSETF